MARFWVQYQAPAGNWVDSTGCEEETQAVRLAKGEQTLYPDSKFRVIERADRVIATPIEVKNWRL